MGDFINETNELLGKAYRLDNFKIEVRGGVLEK